jgi:hypothetical protein
MATQAPQQPKVQFCSVISAESGESPFGSAWHANRYIMVEIPLPWKYDVLESPGVPAGIHDLVHELYDQGIYPAMIGFAPDEAWSVEGFTRIIDYRLPESGPITTYQQREYLLPTANLAELVGPFLRDDHGTSLDRYLVDPIPGQRDVFVCTHGAIDACCAKFGYPTYKMIRLMADNPSHNLRAWRCTHFGGHRFAATMVELPAGRYWGHLEARDLGPILRREASLDVIRARYRGWAALPYGAAQVAECDLFARTGWEWTNAAITPGEAPPFDWESPIAEPQVMSFGVTHHELGIDGSIKVTVTPNGSTRTAHSSGAEIEWHEAQQFTCDIRTEGNVDSLLQAETAPTR